MAHDNHYATCTYCGWVGKESELPVDPDGHPCGADKCPSCGTEGFISCCYKSYEGAESRDESDIDNTEQAMEAS